MRKAVRDYAATLDTDNAREFLKIDEELARYGWYEIVDYEKSELTDVTIQGLEELSERYVMEALKFLHDVPNIADKLNALDTYMLEVGVHPFPKEADANFGL